MDNNDSVGAALARLDEAMAAKPHVDGHSFSRAAHELALLRDTMAARQRKAGATAASRSRLEHLNAVISVVLGGHFPLGDVPWAELEKARDWLARLGDQDAAKE